MTANNDAADFDADETLLNQGAWVEFETSYEVLVLLPHPDVPGELLWQDAPRMGPGCDAQAGYNTMEAAHAAHPDLRPSHFRVYELMMLRRIIPPVELTARARYESGVDHG